MLASRNDTLVMLAPARRTAGVPAAFALRQTSRSCGNVLGIRSPSCLNRSSFVKMPNGETVGSKANRACPYLSSDVTRGSDHGFLTIGARYPAFACVQTEIGVEQPGNVTRSSGALPAA